MKQIFKNTEKGFTLFQLVALIVVLGLIATTAVQLVVILTPSTWENEARQEMQLIRCAVIGCTQGDCGFIGVSGEVPLLLEHLLTDPGTYCNWTGPYLDVTFVDDPFDYLLDPWGNPYIWDAENMTITSTGGGTDPIIISLASSVAELLGHSVQYQFTDENGVQLDSTQIQVFVDYGCEPVQLAYNENIGFYGDGFPACGLEVSVRTISTDPDAPPDTLYPPDCPNPPCQPTPITCEWGQISFINGSQNLGGQINDIVDFDILVSGECTFNIRSVSVEWKGSNWCDETPYLESFKLNDSYWNYLTDNGGVRAVSGQELELSSTLSLVPGEPIAITEMKFASNREGTTSLPMMMDGSKFKMQWFSGLAPTQSTAFTAPGVPPGLSNVQFVNGSVATYNNNCDVKFDIMNIGKCCAFISEMIVAWDTTCVIPYMTEVAIDGSTRWYDTQCRAASGQYIAFEEPFMLCNDVVTVELKSFYDNRGSAWGTNLYDQNCGITVAGEMFVNPNNNDQHEFYLIKPDGSMITRDSLHASKADYTGPAIWVHVKPKGDGNQNSILIDGDNYRLHNSQTYDFISENMNVHLYNDHRDMNGHAMGRWIIGITSGNACLAANRGGYWCGDEGGYAYGSSDADDQYGHQHRFGCENGGGQSGNGNTGNNWYSPPDCPDSDGDGKITICHHPPGNPDNTQTLCVSVNAWEAHRAHGDECGACNEGDVFECSEEPDRVDGSGTCLDMRGQHFTVTIITYDGTEIPLEFDTAPLAPPDIARYGSNITMTGRNKSTVKFYVQNTGNSPVQIDKMEINWDRENTYLSEIEINNDEYWLYSDGDDIRLPSNGIADMNYRYLLKAGQYIAVELVDFKDQVTGSGTNANMEGVDFNISFIGVGDNCVYDVEFTTPGGDDD
ncbi:MAG: hypothetical protein ABIA75_13635 [Candidatus Neomarinimicrobiota bacterium]